MKSRTERSHNKPIEHKPSFVDKIKPNNKHKIFSEMVESLAKLSKCKFTQVGCLIVNESGKIVSTGVNGTISGDTNCCDVDFDNRDQHKPWSDKYEIHAEMNAILELAKSGITPKNITVYTTISPCENCLKHLLGLSSNSITIDKIIYNNKYHRISDLEIDEMKKFCLQTAGVKLLNITEVVHEHKT